MLRDQPALELVEFICPARGRQKSLKERDLAVFVEIGFRVGEGFGEVLPEAGLVLFVAAAGGGNDDAVRGG
jgi:hypothetical protein